MMRSLLFLTHEFAPVTGGAATYARETACAAAALGHRVELWAPARPGAVDDHYPFAVRRLPMKPNQNWPARISLLRALRQANVDWPRTTLYLPEPGPMRLWMYASLIRLPRPQELVLTLHGSEILRFARLPHRRMGFHRILRQADRIGVVSTPVRNLLLHHFPVNPDKVVRVPGALPRDFRPPSNSPARSDDRTRILTVGRIHPRKGQFKVLQALARLDPELRRRVVYQMVGPVRRPAYADRLKRFAQEHQIALEGPNEVSDADLPAAFCGADIFVMASQPEGPSIEGFGLVYLEAARCGVPVIGLNTGGVADAIGPDNGILVAPSEPGALVDAIRKLVTDPELRQQLGSAGPAWADRFSWESNVSTLFPA